MFTLGQLAESLDAVLVGDSAITVSGLQALESAQETDLSFLLESRFFHDAVNSKAAALIVHEKQTEIANQLIVKNPRKALAQAIALFFPQEAPVPLKSQHAVIAESAKIDPTAVIKAGVVIEDNVTIGAGTIIASNTVIESGVSIGEKCNISPNVSILKNVEIGNRVVILSGAVIGGEGFGLYTDAGAHYKIPHVSTVIVEDDVEIGANCCIDRGLLIPTTLQKGCKIDNLVQVGHNVNIGQHSIIVSQVGIVGSAKLGKYVTVGGQVGIASVNIEDNVIVASKAGVTKNISAGQVVSGFPAQSHKKELKEYAALRKLVQTKKKK